MKRFQTFLFFLAMGACVFAAGLTGLPDWATLLIQIPLGAAVYAGLSVLLKNESYSYLLSVLKNFRRKNA